MRTPPQLVQAVAALLTLAVLAVLAAGIYGVTQLVASRQHPVTRAVPTPTQTSAPHVVYRADWSSSGASGWTKPPHWAVSGGRLVNDGMATSADPLTIPYLPTAKHYTIDFDLQIVGMAQGQVCRQYGVQALGADGGMLYTAGTQCLAAKSPYFGGNNLVVHGDSAVDSNSASDFVPGQGVRNYHIEVDDDTVDYCVSDSCLDTVASTLPLKPARIVLLDTGVRLAITNFRVTAY
jgi:hypothetical protein